MLTRKTTVDCLEIFSDGSVGVRLALLVMDDETEVSKKYHRTVVASGEDPAPQMQAVNDHLQMMGEQPVDDAAVNRIRAYIHMG